MPDVPDPTLFAIPFFLVALLAEVPILRRMRRRGADVLGYPERRDTAASLAMGVGSIPFVTAYAGIFIVWDRLFRSFEEEGERVVYGLTKDVDTWNPLRIAFHEYAAIGRDVLRAKLRARGGEVRARRPGSGRPWAMTA